MLLTSATATCAQVLNSMASLDIEGHANFAAAVQIAQLALKHRQNKNQRQRIVIFVGSPLAESQVGDRSVYLCGCWGTCVVAFLSDSGQKVVSAKLLQKIDASLPCRRILCALQRS